MRSRRSPGARRSPGCRAGWRSRLETRGLGHVPARGRVIAVCNHPTGVADGIAVLRRPERPRGPICVFYANADAAAGRPAPRRGGDPGGVGRGQAQPRHGARDAETHPRGVGRRAPAGDLSRRSPGAAGAEAPARRPAVDAERLRPGAQAARADRADAPGRPVLQRSSICSTDFPENCATSPCSTRCSTSAASASA